MTIDIADEHIDPDDARAYRFLADKVIEWFNPPDADEAEEAIHADAIERAAKFIQAQPCTCPAAPPGHYDLDVCARCEALGRAADEPLQR